jgi:hypothetical protein
VIFFSCTVVSITASFSKAFLPCRPTDILKIFSQPASPIRFRK